ncbi:MAG: macro domain-containing protein [Desulfovibrionaceae bacterium]
MERFSIKEAWLSVTLGDLTQSGAQAIVNAANPQLAGGGGVDGAIHQAASPELLQACREIIQDIGELPAGEAVITPGFNLSAEWVIHTVGPIYRDGAQGERETLLRAYRNCLKTARDNGVATVDFPAISCGVYGYPLEEGAAVAAAALVEGLEMAWVREARLVLFKQRTFDVFLQAVKNRLEAGL